MRLLYRRCAGSDLHKDSISACIRLGTGNQPEAETTEMRELTADAGSHPETEIIGIPMYFEEAIEQGLDLSGDLAICGVDNNPARVAVSRYFKKAGTPVIFTGVSADGDHGYVFVQEKAGPCLGCLFPDIANDDRFPCPGTPAIADILQAIGALAVYSADTLLMERVRTWNYRRISLSNSTWDGASVVPNRQDCPISPN